MAPARQLTLDIGPVCPVAGCKAPLCPRDRNSVSRSVWYPGEPVCTARPAPEWVGKQRRLARTRSSKHTFFTVRMLNRIAEVNEGIRGADPEQPEKVKRYRASTGKRATRRKAKAEETKQIGLLAWKRPDKVASKATGCAWRRGQDSNLR